MRRTILTIVASFLAVLTVVAIVFFNPALLITPAILGVTQKYLKTKNVELTWSRANIQTESLSFWKRRIHLGFNNICLAIKPELDKACFDEVTIAAVTDLKGFSFNLQAVEKLKLVGGKVTVNSTSQEKIGNGQKPGRPSLPDWLKETEVGELSIDIDQLKINSGDDTVRVSGTIRTNNKPDQLTAYVTAKEELFSKNIKIQSSNGQITFAGKSRQLKDLNRADFLTNARFNRDRLKLKGALTLRSADAFNFDVDVFYAETDLNINARTQGVATLSTAFLELLTINGTANGRVTEVIEQIPGISVSRCSFSFDRQAVELQGEKFSAECSAGLEFQKLAQKFIPDLQLPSKQTVRVQFDAFSNSFFEENIRLGATIFADSITTNLVGVAAKIALDGNGKLEQFPANWNWSSLVNANVNIPSYEKVVAALFKTPWAVPAPVSVLTGTIKATVKANLSHDQLIFPVVLESDLLSEDQTFRFTAKGELGFEKDNEIWDSYLDLRVSLDDVKLALPRMSLVSFPKLFPDSRFVGEIEEKNNGKFRYNLRFGSPSNPVKLVSNLAQNEVPVYLDLRITDAAPISGNVTVKDFSLKIFRRNATLERLYLDLQPTPFSETIVNVDGTLRVDYTDYTVKVLLGGTADRPSIRLASTPALPEDQLVAALLFGRPVEELDPQEEESVGNAKAAFANRAIGLTSLYLLASTPIESLGYDSQSDAFVARVRIGEKTTLNVETGPTEIESVGIRKRLSRFWTVATDISGATEGDYPRLSAFFEWSNRY